ncbi:MAG: methionine--tRNA ligase [Patescibacteria group bacterium]|nr:methionine--tRNA ligase [Patescibacteria group bacterium]
MSKFYITTTLPYVNAEPHIGFAAEIIKADCLARWHTLLGDEVFFNTGTDEHGQKIYEKAKEAGIDPQTYCDEYAAKFRSLKELLNLSVTNFIRTTDEKHIKAAQAFWKLCEANGDIYKKDYKIKYCVGCELEKTDSELVNGCCPLHPNKALEEINEENYFFKFSKYQQPLLDLYKNNPDFVKPEERANEIKSFVERGLQDFSISRLATKMPWGIPVPGDETQVMYVWFDALVNYISCLGWPDTNHPQTPPSEGGGLTHPASPGSAPLSRGDFDTPRPSTQGGQVGTPLDRGDLFSEYWPGLQVCGKDNLRQQTAMWQAMLMSAGLPNSKQVLVFGFITVNGQKMSKSLGNVVNPAEMVVKYGLDATRYYLLKEIKPFADSDFSWEKMNLLYTADLANGIGNLAARVSTLLEKNQIETVLLTPTITHPVRPGGVHPSQEGTFAAFAEKMEQYAFDEALGVLWKKIAECDVTLTEKKPWKMEDKAEIKKVLEPIAQEILNIAYLLAPFMPETSEKIIKQYSETQIKKSDSLFPRI